MKELDFERRQVTVRQGKGRKDRVTVLPGSVAPHLAAHLERVRAQHADDVSRGFGRVSLPGALIRKYPEADKAWGW